jgi:hypothetical protein
MKRRTTQLAISLGTFLFASTSVSAATGSAGISFSEPLDKIIMDNGTELHLDIGIGSGAYRLESDPENVIYTITDRGPNIATSDAGKLMGVDYGEKKGKIFPTPNFSPTIYKLLVNEDIISILEKIQLKNFEGHPVSGISNPDTEPAWDIRGNELSYDSDGIDAECIVKLKDGTFWIGEEYGPSILHVTADGKVIERWVPQGVKPSLVNAGYEVRELLPSILRARPINRGIESLAVSPDERYLYFAMQSPLANPDSNAYKSSRNLRLFKIDREAGCIVGEFVYRLDTPDSFTADNMKKIREQNDVKVSEMTAIGPDKLVILERISSTTKFYRVDLSQADNIFDSKWDKMSTLPSLEQYNAKDIVTLEKTLLMNSDERGGLMNKIEGMAWLGRDQWLMVNDNDFGIEGDITRIAPVAMSVK